SVLGRQVAVKVLRDDLALPAAQRAVLFARMRQEARAAAAVIHPNLVILHDMGEDPDLGLYLVFEYVPGVTLRDRIVQGSIDVEEITVLARAIGRRARRAHRAG